MGKVRGTHSSPGIYTQITDLQYAAKSMGITTLGLVGETLKGPAFEPIAISDWAQFQDYFGGTSAEKFIGSKYPKYELPYIAKSYLSVSDQLQVCRVLGLSGYNAGPAWTLSVGSANDKKLVAVLRSRGLHKEDGTIFNCDNNERGDDEIDFYCSDIKIAKTVSDEIKLNCSGKTTTSSSSSTPSASVDGYDLNTLIEITCTLNNNNIVNYVVSLDPSRREYIYNVLGSNPLDGDAPVFIEALYDLELMNVLGDNKKTLYVDKHDFNKSVIEVEDFALPKNILTKDNVGKLYLVKETVDGVQAGCIAEVNENLNYVHKTEHSGKIAYVKSVNAYYNSDMELVFNPENYKEQFRHALTPWFVSEVKGSNTQMEVKKLFRFHTITDGNCANEQVKITIANIRPEEGTFDVLVRDYYDTDGNQRVLESYRGVNMVPGSPKYVGLRIGTLNGDYELKSKYVMIEVIENEMTEMCVPCGFLGYPVQKFDNINVPVFTYNNEYDDTIRPNKQCFGLSNIKGVDVDMLQYKGADVYTEDYSKTGNYTKGFHLDWKVGGGIDNAKVTVDGVEVKGFVSVTSNPMQAEFAPSIGSESLMSNTIYRDIKLRKFTCYPYGGFDGWDAYRKSRSNTDKYNANKYNGKAYGEIKDGEGLALDSRSNTSDYYAYLAGYKQFENPEKIMINLFATPGIDYVNNTLLSHEVLDMIHERKDTFYVMTTPDKPMGADDAMDEMYSPSNAVSNLEGSAIDTYYASTYYPWVRYYDSINSKYISLPVTKDVLRNMANVDNKKYPWYAPAGIERGNVDCTRARMYTKLEDADIVYDGNINPVKTFSVDGVKIWGNKTMYSEETPMNRINTVRLVLYMRKLISEAVRVLLFDPNDKALKSQFEGIVAPILAQIKSDRGITDYRLSVQQTPEMMDAHELQCTIYIKPVPTLEYIEINFVVTPQGVEFGE